VRDIGADQQGNQEDYHHFSLVAIGYSLRLRGSEPGYQRWEASSNTGIGIHCNYQKVGEKKKRWGQQE